VQKSLTLILYQIKKYIHKVSVIYVCHVVVYTVLRFWTEFPVGSSHIVSQRLIKWPPTCYDSITALRARLYFGFEWLSQRSHSPSDSTRRHAQLVSPSHLFRCLLDKYSRLSRSVSPNDLDHISWVGLPKCRSHRICWPRSSRVSI